MPALSTSILLANLASHIFLGEAYPSGSVYLQPFSSSASNVKFDSRPDIKTFPETIHFHCVEKKSCQHKDVGKRFRKATRQEYFDPHLTSRGKSTEAFDYIPGREQMDTTHNKECGLKYKKDKRYKYADGEDFFETVADLCFSDDAVLRYKAADPSKDTAYRVIAATDDTMLTNISFGKGDADKRLATKDEITKEKEVLAASGRSDEECTTQPGSIQNAKVILTATVAKTSDTVRISSFTDPGCDGHLLHIYLLDVLKDGKLLKTYTISRYFGPI